MAEVSGLVAPSEYQAARTRLFPSPQSWAWFQRQHRSKLVEAGALLVVAGRNILVEDLTDQVVLEVGRRSAADRSAA